MKVWYRIYLHILINGCLYTHTTHKWESLDEVLFARMPRSNSRIWFRSLVHRISPHLLDGPDVHSHSWQWFKAYILNPQHIFRYILYTYIIMLCAGTRSQLPDESTIILRGPHSILFAYVVDGSTSHILEHKPRPACLQMQA